MPQKSTQSKKTGGKFISAASSSSQPQKEKTRRDEPKSRKDKTTASLKPKAGHGTDSDGSSEESCHIEDMSDQSSHFTFDYSENSDKGFPDETTEEKNKRLAKKKNDCEVKAARKAALKAGKMP